MKNKSIEQYFGNLSNWRIENGKLERNFEFTDFKEAMEFMNQVAEIAEKLNHHPDWSNSYNKVQIRLFTHDKNSLTEKDLELARAIDQII